MSVHKIIIHIELHGSVVVVDTVLSGSSSLSKSLVFYLSSLVVYMSRTVDKLFRNVFLKLDLKIGNIFKKIL